MARAHSRTNQQKRFVAIDRILLTKPEPRRTLAEIIRQVNSQVPHPDFNKEWSSRTIKRDIHDMRKAEAPIDRKAYTDSYGDKHEVYCYSRDYEWPDIGFDQNDLHSLQLAGTILAPYRGLPAIGHLIELGEKVEHIIEAKSGKNPRIPIFFSPLADNQVDPEIWQAVLEAATNQKMLTITYSGWKGQPDSKPRNIAPYAIVNLEGEWHVIGTAQAKDNSLRQYKLSRILSAKATPASFKIPAGFDIHKILNHTFGGFVGSPDDLETVRIRFKAKISTQIRGRKWHPKQTLSENKNGDLTLSFPVSKAGPWPYYHVISWILSWGANAEVLAPEELKELVAEEVKKMATQGDPYMKKEFLIEQALVNSVGAAFQRAEIYVKGLADMDPLKVDLRKNLREELQSLAQSYKNPVTDAKHKKNIETLSNTLSNAYSGKALLRGDRFRIGIAQKALNLFLKYLWCLEEIPEPPHCPVDAIILKKIGISDRWTSSDDIKEYETWIAGIATHAKPQTVAQWELENWGN